MRKLYAEEEEPMDHLTVDQLADALQEPNRPLLRQVLRVLGHARTTALLAEALQCEATGGMLTADGTRRRTPGGVFFHVVRQQASPKERQRLFPRPTPPHRQAPSAGQTTPVGGPPPPVLPWDEVSPIIQTLATHPPGEARTMKLTLIGRPGTVEVREQAVVFRMQGKAPGPLPKGLPPLPSTPALTWNVMVALRQWNRVKDSLEGHQDDQLIIEGYPVLQGTEHVVLAQSCVSVLQQRAQKQARQQTASAPAAPERSSPSRAMVAGRKTA
jgi:hypothetical protein